MLLYLHFVIVLRSGLCKKKVTVAISISWNTIKPRVLFTSVRWLAKELEVALRSPFRLNPCSKYKAHEDTFEVRNGALKEAEGEEALNPINTEWDQNLVRTLESPRLVPYRHSGVSTFMHEVLLKKGARHMCEIWGISSKLQAFPLNFPVVFLTF